MNKEHERQCFDLVYGHQAGLTMSHAEEPDFICTDSTGFTFGVEIAEYWPSESMARLHNRTGYFQNILDGMPHIHKDDVKALQFVDITYIPADGSGTFPLKAMAIAPVGHAEVAEAAIKRIAYKAGKLPSYHKNAKVVDLVIADPSKSIAVKQSGELINCILQHRDYSTIAECGFREVYLLLGHSKGLMASPVKCVCFFSHISSFRLLFDDYCKTLSEAEVDKYLIGDYFKLLDVHLAKCFSSVSMCQYENSRNYYYSGSVYKFTEDLNWEIMNYDDLTNAGERQPLGFTHLNPL